jgi:hypothetical protein
MFQGCIIPRRLVPMTTNDCVTIKEMKGKILGSTANHDTHIYLVILISWCCRSGTTYTPSVTISYEVISTAYRTNWHRKPIWNHINQEKKLNCELRKSGNNFSSRVTELNSEITTPDFDNSHPSTDHSYNLRRRENTAQYNNNSTYVT